MRLSPRKLEDLIIISDNTDVLNDFSTKLPPPQPNREKNPFSRIRMTVLGSNNNVVERLSDVFLTDELYDDDQFTSDDDSD